MALAKKILRTSSNSYFKVRISSSHPETNISSVSLNATASCFNFSFKENSFFCSSANSSCLLIFSLSNVYKIDSWILLSYKLLWIDLSSLVCLLRERRYFSISMHPLNMTIELLFSLNESDSSCVALPVLLCNFSWLIWSLGINQRCLEVGQGSKCELFIERSTWVTIACEIFCLCEESMIFDFEVFQCLLGVRVCPVFANYELSLEDFDRWEYMS